MADARRTLGKRGEMWAADHLQSIGFEIVARNWRCAAGEIDLVATVTAPDYSTGDTGARWLVLVEVRTRRGMRFGSARASVAAHKQARLRTLAQMYVDTTGWRGPWRIDVIAIQLHSNQPPRIEHIPHAVHAE